MGHVSSDRFSSVDRRFPGLRCIRSGRHGRPLQRCKVRVQRFEPNWQFTTGLDGDGEPVVRFLDPENPGWEQGSLVVSGCVLQGSPNDFEVTTDAPVSLVGSIVGQSCTEPNGELTDFSVTVTYTQGAISSTRARVEGTGCCTRLD